MPRRPPIGRGSAGTVTRRCSPTDARRPETLAALVGGALAETAIQSGALAAIITTAAIQSRRRRRV